MSRTIVIGKCQHAIVDSFLCFFFFLVEIASYSFYSIFEKKKKLSAETRKIKSAYIEL